MLYFDSHASAPLAEVAVKKMLEHASSAWANPSSVHQAGRMSRKYIETAREQLASVLKAQATDIIWTSGGSEACHLGILGLSLGVTRIITTKIEHPAVVRVCEMLGQRGISIDWMNVNEKGAVDADVINKIDQKTLVVMQWVNHETGIILPIEEVSLQVRTKGARLFVDATQALGKLPIDIHSLGATAVAFAANKVGGPTGVGALWVERGASIEPVLVGGSQERGRRAGTPNILGIIGFGAVAEVLNIRLQDMERISQLRDQIENALVMLGAQPNGNLARRVATVTNVSVPRWKGSWLVAALDVEGLCCSSGAACSSGLETPSPIITALYPHEPERATSALRLSLGVQTTPKEVEQAIEILGTVIAKSSVKQR